MCTGMRGHFRDCAVLLDRNNWQEAIRSGLIPSFPFIAGRLRLTVFDIAKAEIDSQGAVHEIVMQKGHLYKTTARRPLADEVVHSVCDRTFGDCFAPPRYVKCLCWCTIQHRHRLSDSAQLHRTTKKRMYCFIWSKSTRTRFSTLVITKGNGGQYH